MLFRDREDAGKRLAEALRGYMGRDEAAVIFALPRGGIVVAREVARALSKPLDLIVVRKIGAPGIEEFAIGAVAEEGAPILNRRVIDAGSIPGAHLTQAIETARQEVQRRVRAYRLRPRADVRGKTAVIVDDGIATGLTIEAAIATVREWGAHRVVIAVPVAPSETVTRLRSRVDDIVVLNIPDEFYAVGQFYADFRQVDDWEVTAALREPSVAVSPQSQT
jgi:putative phosphoribosyl transferase